MSIKAVKHLVATLHSDEGARSRFASEPDAVLSEYRLTAGEKAAIKTAHLRVRPNGAVSREQSAGTLVFWIP